MADIQGWYIFFLIPYFLPSVIATAIGHRRARDVFLLNLLLGWTVLGWIGALFWAVKIPPNRRTHPRFEIPVRLPLHCAPADQPPFEAEITDLSRGGMAVMISGPGVKLSPGAVLNGCTFVVPGGETVAADLKVCNIQPIAQPGADPVQRAGLRFLAEPKGIDSLLGTLSSSALPRPSPVQGFKEDALEKLVVDR